ncbi:MAG: HEPN domain-containing protein [Nanoarchaeota archaeon]
MNTKNIILKAFEREKRGLKLISREEYLVSGHIKKADHNLIVMTDLSKLKHEDWVVVVAYYSMYQVALALLVKVGLESKEHSTTVAVLEHFFSKQISKELIERFNELKEKRDGIESIFLEEKYLDYIWKIKIARERVQYGIDIDYKETENVMKNARDFVSRIKLVISELDEDIIEIIINEIKNLEGSIKNSRRKK